MGVLSNVGPKYLILLTYFPRGFRGLPPVWGRNTRVFSVVYRGSRRSWVPWGLKKSVICRILYDR